MGDWLFYLAGAACLATLAVLAFGIGGFGTGKMTPQRQNKMMRWRIIAQFAAVVLMLLAVWVTKGSS
jgi:uncharacterized membrane protein